jgi:ParB-like chromosome segregation protein Spo0J
MAELPNENLLIEMWAIERIKPYARNPRKNDAAIDRMAEAIRTYGFKIPVLIRGDGELIDGHLRWKAAVKMGLREIPVIRCDDWSPEQVRAFRLSVNRSATWADWDEQLLALEMAELKAADFDLSLTGFNAPEIDALLFSGDLDQRADEVPEPQPKVVSATGDVWGCGDHRVGCGDSTDGASVERLLAARIPHLMVTDPS